MATYSKQILSGSANGRGIKVIATSSIGTTIHSTLASLSTLDEVWLYAYNSAGSSVTLTIQYGGTTSPDDDIKLSIPTQSGLTLVVPGFIMSGNGSTFTTIRAFAGTANVITIHGYVNRIE